MHLQIGIIGAGYAATMHAKALALINPNISICIYDIQSEVAHNFAKEHGCLLATSMEDLYNNVDAVIIATPSSTHYKLVMEAMEREKHVLCEKPMASAASEAYDMFALSQVKNLICAIGFNYRFFEISNILGETVDLGEKKQIYILINRLFRKDKRNIENGVLSDLGIHLIDYITYICNQDIDMDSCKVWMKCAKEGDYDTTICGKTEYGISFKIAVARIKEHSDVCFNINIVGTNGCFKYDSRQETIYTIKQKHNTQVSRFEKSLETSDFFDFTDSILRQDEEWINAILGGSIIKLATFKDGLKSQAALDNFLKNKILY